MSDVDRYARAERLPAWPVRAGLAGFPLWWLVGLVDLAWILLAAVMVLYLVRAGPLRVPRAYGLWLLFVLLLLCSAIGVDTAGQATAFAYRGAHFMAATVIIIYVFNARRSVTPRVIAAGFAVLLVTTAIGGYLGMFWPNGSYHSPLSFVMPGALSSNDLVHQMVVRPFAQFDPDGYFQVDPRPSAPYLFTNNWGSMYVLLLPFVVVRLLQLRGTPRFRWLALALAASTVPAFMTLNRGMFLGIGLLLVYLALRRILIGNIAALIGLLALAAGAVIAWPTVVGILAERRAAESSDASRTALYRTSVEAALQSPWFGYGHTLPPVTPDTPPVGTHGQFWQIVVLNGIPASIAFLGFFLVAYLVSVRRWDAVGFAAHAVLLVGLTQFFFYGHVPYGLPVLAIAAAVAMRPPGAGKPPGGTRQSEYADAPGRQRAPG